jgi:Fe2+ transport system protein FeoA
MAAIELTGPGSTPSAPAVQLTHLRAGDSARFQTSELAKEDRDLLRAVGMTERCQLRVCKAGDPWIVQVRTTRIGISDRLAAKILVVPADGQ